jgi:DNA-binding PadR family transcriptional regulator
MSESDMSKPLPPAPFLILVALLGGDIHGYGLLQAVRDQSRGRVPIGTGSLYRHLSKLIDAGLVVELEAPAKVDPRRGTYYRLTPRGRRVLVAERERLHSLVRAFDTMRAERRGQA